MMFEQLLTGRNLMLAGAIFVIMTVMKTPFKEFWASRWGQRVLPIIPVVLGIGGGFAGLCDCNTWQDKLLIGLLAGFASAHIFKMGKTSVMGYGLPDLDGDGVPDAPAATITPAEAITAVPAPAPVAAPAPAAEKKE